MPDPLATGQYLLEDWSTEEKTSLAERVQIGIHPWKLSLDNPVTTVGLILTYI